MKKIHLLRWDFTLFARHLSIIGVVGFLWLSCAPKPKILPQDRTPESVLKCVQEKRIEFQTFACLLDLKLKGKEAKFSGTIEFVYRAPDHFAFYPRSFLGMDVFKAKGANDSLTIYFPKNNEYYSGSFSDLEKTGLWSWKISLQMLQDMILRQGELMENDLIYAGISENEFIYKFEDENWIKEYWIDPQRCRVKKSRLMHKGDEEPYQIEYQNYATYDKMEIPKVIKIKTMTNEFAQITFLERRFNLSIPEKKFEFQIPANARRVTFENSTK